MPLLFQLVFPKPEDITPETGFCGATTDESLANRWKAAGRRVFYRHYFPESMVWGSPIKDCASSCAVPDEELERIGDIGDARHPDGSPVVVKLVVETIRTGAPHDEPN